MGQVRATPLRHLRYVLRSLGEMCILAFWGHWQPQIRKLIELQVGEAIRSAIYSGTVFCHRTTIACVRQKYFIHMLVLMGS